MRAMSNRSATSGTAAATTSATVVDIAGVGESTGELVPRFGGAFGVGVEELVVVRPADLLDNEGEDVAVELQRSAGAESFDRRLVEESGQRRRLGDEAVVDLGAVRDAAPRSDVEDRFTAARLVSQAGNAILLSSPPVLSRSTNRPPRPSVTSTSRSVNACPNPRAMTSAPGSSTDRSSSAVCPGGQMDESVPGGERGGGGHVRVGFGIEMAERHDDLVDDELLERSPDSPGLASEIV